MLQSCHVVEEHGKNPILEGLGTASARKKGLSTRRSSLSGPINNQTARALLHADVGMCMLASYEGR